jgi:dUTP pyrophosphatase
MNLVRNQDIVVRFIGPRPIKQTPGSSGYDLVAAADERVLPGETCVIPTGLRIELPVGVGIEAQVRPRSGLSKKGLLVHLGTIDSDYRGEIGVIVTAVGSRQIEIAKGDRIAQLVFAPVLSAHWHPATELGETARGDGGFGSTGA